MPSVDVLKLVFRRPRKILSSPGLKLCQFSLQPSKFQKTACYFTEVPAHEFATVPAACTIVNICEHVPNNLFRRAKKLSDLAILQTARDEEDRLEVHWFQEIC